MTTGTLTPEPAVAEPVALTAYPMLKEGVEFSKPKDAGYWVANLPGESRFFRFGDPDYELCTLLDGNRGLDQVAAELGLKLARQISSTALLPALKQLTDMGMIDPASVRALGIEPEQVRDVQLIQPNRQSVVFFKIKALDPTRLLERLYPFVAPLLKPLALSIYLAIFVAAAAAVVVSWSEVTAQVGFFIDGAGNIAKAALIAYLVQPPLIVAHEFAHALTARRFNVKVREMGALLIYFSPALYADVSEAYRASRAAKLWVGSAGVILNLVVGAVALLLWALLLQGTLAGDVAFVLAFISILGSVTNLNPLIRLDGYYLLSDWLHIPNLRTRSFRLWAQVLRLRFSALEPIQLRERMIYLTYGAVAGLFSLALIGWSTYLFSTLLGNLVGPIGRTIGLAVIPTMVLLNLLLIRIPPPKRFAESGG